jgi:hypothetical protein
MDRVLSLTTFDEERATNAALDYWLSRAPEERIAEVERLRREYMEALEGAERHGIDQRFPRSLRLVKRDRSRQVERELSLEKPAIIEICP